MHSGSLLQLSGAVQSASLVQLATVQNAGLMPWELPASVPAGHWPPSGGETTSARLAGAMAIVASTAATAPHLLVR